jgi:hypothetical protein
MAEIRSTLDLVMERTRGLSMTDTEKNEMKKKELSGKIQALLERYSNDYLTLKWLETELNNMGMETDPKIRKTLKFEILERLSPNGDGDKLLEALEGITGIRADAYRGIISEYDKTLEQRRKKFAEKIIAGLSLQKISGSAVSPNMSADPGWQKELEKISGEFRKKIRAA